MAVCSTQEAAIHGSKDNQQELNKNDKFIQ
jgi:hypothetical protein